MNHTCPQFNTPCRFCSIEHLYIPYAPLIENPKTNRLEAGATAIRKEALGEWCNNISQWVRELRYCPARWGLYGVATSGIRADGCGEYSDEYGQSQIPGEDMFLIVGTGQQTLGSVIEI
jgi:hypothetical protein